jgi:hypothetical protein
MRCNVKGLCVFLMLAISTASAGELVYEFSNPAFSGRGYSTHVLSTEQLRYNREQEIRERKEAEQRRIERELEDTILNKFITNLESRIYATLSKQMVDNMFKECEPEDTSCTEPGGGSTTIEGSTITWTKDSSGAINLTVDGPDGFTEIEIPGPGELRF